tara:strand:+ start:210 stop:389 length:180 start_codon:yes stop_codon:yes gene_type:complete
MDNDELEPILKSKSIDFDTISISELETYIDKLKKEISKCKKYIESKQKDRALAESIFKK